NELLLLARELLQIVLSSIIVPRAEPFGGRLPKQVTDRGHHLRHADVVDEAHLVCARWTAAPERIDVPRAVRPAQRAAQRPGHLRSMHAPCGWTAVEQAAAPEEPDRPCAHSRWEVHRLGVYRDNAD